MIDSRMQAETVSSQFSHSVKRAIVDHPLYPLLQIVFQKCELATCSPRDPQSESVCSSESFSREIREFVTMCRAQCRSVATDDEGMDKFMVLAIEVLRMHLLELEKVHQLCDSFCQRYITALKGKMPVDYVVEDSNNNSSSSSGGGGGGNAGGGGSGGGGNLANAASTAGSATTAASATTNGTGANGSAQPPNGTPSSSASNGNFDNSTSNNGAHIDYPTSTSASSSSYYYDPAAMAQHQQQHHSQASAYGSQSAAVAAAAAAATYAALDTRVKYEPLAASNDATALNGQQAHHTNSSTSASQLAAGNHSQQQQQQDGGGGKQHDDARSPTGSTGSYQCDASLDGTECDDDEQRNRRQQKKRGIFPKSATNAMRNWLFHHLNHPYPSEEQKKQLAEATGLTILQVNNWFINARRRIVQPMIDQSNRHSGGTIMGAAAYSPDPAAAAAAAAGMSYMMGHDRSQQFNAAALGGVDPASMSLAASHAAAAMGAYQAASAQHLSQAYGRPHQSQPAVAAAAVANHAAMLAAAGQPPAPHMMGALQQQQPNDYY